MRIHYNSSILSLLLLKGANAFTTSLSTSNTNNAIRKFNGRRIQVGVVPTISSKVVTSSSRTSTELHISGTRRTNINRTTKGSITSKIEPPSDKRSSLTTAEVTSTTDIINPFLNDDTTSKLFPSSSSSSSSSSSLASENDKEYKLGLTIIGFITLMFSSNSPVLHAAFVNSSNPPSVLLLNAATSSIALMGLILFGPIVNSVVPLPSVLQENQNVNNVDTLNVDDINTPSNDNNIDGSSSSKNQPYLVAGIELGFWKTLGTTANLYGLSFTSANHAAFLIQLTTLIVPSVQGLMGVPVPQQIWTSIALALSGIFLFTQDMSAASTSAEALAGANTMLLGDALCVVAAAFYATYDLRLFNYGKKVPPLPLIRTKIAVQACLSCVMLATLGEHDGLNEVTTYVTDLLSSSSPSDLTLVGSAVLWSGLVINALVPFLQVSGQQIVGASRAQVVYASQPLWAAILSFILLGETLGEKGAMGGFLFLTAIFLAASAESPEADCEEDICEV